MNIIMSVTIIIIIIINIIIIIIMIVVIIIINIIIIVSNIMIVSCRDGNGKWYMIIACTKSKRFVELHYASLTLHVRNC